MDSSSETSFQTSFYLYSDLVFDTLPEEILHDGGIFIMMQTLIKPLLSFRE